MAKIVDNPTVTSIIGNPTVTPTPASDWDQDNDKRANYIKNKPTYLTDFFKEVPEGKTIDDLTIDNGYEGVYLLGKPGNLESRCDILNVCTGYYWMDNFGDHSTTYQIRHSFDGYNYVIKQRYFIYDFGWTDWEETFATKDYVYKEISKIDISDNITIDQTYSPTSENAQSGKAVAEGIGEVDAVLEEIIELQDIYIDGSNSEIGTVIQEHIDKAVDETKKYVDDKIDEIDIPESSGVSDYNALTNIPMTNLLPDTNLDNIMELGVYAGVNTVEYNTFTYTLPFILLVSDHNRIEDGVDHSVPCQVIIHCDPLMEQPYDIIQRRTWRGDHWDVWVSVGDEIMGDISISKVMVDQEYNPESENAQSGIAVAEAIDGSVGDINNALEELIEIQDSIIKGNEYIPSSGNIEVDQEYNPESPNAQSGIAVAQAIEGSVGGETPFELIAELTTSEEVSKISIDKDINGDAFELKEVYMWVEFPEHTTTFSPYLGVRGNGNGDAFLTTDKSKTTFICTASSELPKIKLEQYQYGYAWKTCKLNSLSSIGTFNRMTTATYSGQVMPTGTIIRIYGKRV